MFYRPSISSCVSRQERREAEGARDKHTEKVTRSQAELGLKGPQATDHPPLWEPERPGREAPEPAERAAHCHLESGQRG